MNKAIITVVGQDTVGIIARVCTYLSGHHVNVLDISQTIMNGIFTMTMMVTLNEDVSPFNEVQSALAEDAKELGVQVTMQRADVFRMMHEV